MIKSVREVLEELLKKHTEEMSDEDSEGGLHSYDYLSEEEFIKEAVLALHSLILGAVGNNDIKSVFEKYFEGKIVPFATKDACNGVKASEAVNAVVQAIKETKSKIEEMFNG